MIHKSAAFGAAAGAAALIFTVDPTIAQAAGRCGSIACSGNGNCPGTTLDCGTMTCNMCNMGISLCQCG
jgi:hypothetical protein